MHRLHAMTQSDLTPCSFDGLGELFAEDLQQAMIDNPWETESDSFYFVGDTMIMHNKVRHPNLPRLHPRPSPPPCAFMARTPPDRENVINPRGISNIVFLVRKFIFPTLS